MFLKIFNDVSPVDMTGVADIHDGKATKIEESWIPEFPLGGKSPRTTHPTYIRL